MADPIRIVNCHTHILTLDFVPKDFLPLKIAHVLPVRSFARSVAWALRMAKPFDSRDLFSRYANFVEIGAAKSQEAIFDKLAGYYPSLTRFVVLPMDLEHMGAGPAPRPLAAQHEELEALARGRHRNGEPRIVLPFIAVDPRRQTPDGALTAMVADLLSRRHEDGQRVFAGVKLYPPLGYSPEDPALDPIWALCAAEGAPVMTHCSRGGVKSKRHVAERAAGFADPDRYLSTMRKHPDLRLCLAHFGGETDWKMYFNSPESRRKVDIDADLSARRHMNWLTKIMQIMGDDRYANLYTDVSYTIFNIVEYVPALKVFLTDDRIRSRTLFGSDFFMAEPEELDERHLSIRVRAGLGEDVFREIAETNPKRYLGEDENGLDARRTA